MAKDLIYHNDPLRTLVLIKEEEQQQTLEQSAFPTSLYVWFLDVTIENKSYIYVK